MMIGAHAGRNVLGRRARIHLTLASELKAHHYFPGAGYSALSREQEECHISLFSGPNSGAKFVPTLVWRC